jgi:branched-chain amino acid transport system ATP-binding protein
LMGLITSSGQIEFAGRAIENRTTEQRARVGMVLVPEGRGILGPLSVMENLELGAYGRYGRAPGADINASFKFVFELFPRLNERRPQKAGSLSGGEQQMLAIGRALMAQPRLLLLDEPSLGLAPRLVEEIFGKLTELKRRGISLLLVEQKAPPALQLAERAYVLRTGQIVTAMATRDITDPEALARLYLGG